MNRIVEMLQVNTVVQAIYLDQDPVGRGDIYQTSVRPRLEQNKQNKFRKRIVAIQEAPISLSEKLLGRAFQKVREDPARVWMLLSENVSVALALGKRPVIESKVNP
jgi:hypothetical protein